MIVAILKQSLKYAGKLVAAAFAFYLLIIWIAGLTVMKGSELEFQIICMIVCALIGLIPATVPLSGRGVLDGVASVPYLALFLLELAKLGEYLPVFGFDADTFWGSVAIGTIVAVGVGIAVIVLRLGLAGVRRIWRRNSTDVPTT